VHSIDVYCVIDIFVFYDIFCSIETDLSELLNQQKTSGTCSYTFASIVCRELSDFW